MKKKSVCIITAIAMLVFSAWGAIAPLFVYALPPALLKAKTIGELIVTLFASAGTAITNNTVIPAIYSAYDSNYFSLESMISSGVLVPADPNVTVEQSIEILGTGTSSSKPFNLDYEEFREYVYGNWESMEDYGIDAILRFNNIANTDSIYGAVDNLGQLVLDVANYGYLGTSNAIAIVANPGSVIEVGIQNVLDAVKEVYGPNINDGIQINNVVDPNYKNVICENYYTDGRIIRNNVLIDGDYTGIYWAKVPRGLSCMGKKGDGNVTIAVGSTLEIAQDVMNQYPTTIRSDPNIPYSVTNMTGNNVSNSIVYGAVYCGEFVSIQDFVTYLTNNDIPYNLQAEDVINQDQGNIYDLNDITPAINGNEKIEIIDSDDYNNFIEESENNPGSDNAVIMDEFLNPYIISEQDIPEDWENQEIPNTNPINPVQPTLAPKPTVAPENIEDIMIPVVPNVQEIFPFCIPWDLLSIVRGFDIEREAPIIEWEFKVDRLGIDYTFVIDLSSYDEAASILRTMELLLFIVGLAVATRKLIGA